MMRTVFAGDHFAWDISFGGIKLDANNKWFF